MLKMLTVMMMKMLVMMPPTIFSITITHPPCREGRVNHRPHPQLRRIKCQICHIWYRYLMFDRPSPPLRRINYQIYYIWCRYLIFDRPSPWLWRMPTRNLLFAFSSLSLPSWSDQCFFYVRKVINSYVIPRRTNCGNMPLWINGFLRPPSIFFDCGLCELKIPARVILFVLKAQFSLDI